MEYDRIKQLIDDMGNSKLTAIDIEFPDGMKISMKKEMTKQVEACNNISNSNIDNNDKKYIIETSEENVESLSDNANTIVIKSPMVGTFYAKPSPTADEYVKVGQEIKKGDTLCIIEAMKLMNEIESEFAGKIKEILVNDGQVVEYGTPLFVIE